jgi:hypothetical protein
MKNSKPSQRWPSSALFHLRPLFSQLRFEGGSWGCIHPQPAPRSHAKRCRKRSPSASPATISHGQICRVHVELLPENGPFLIATPIIRNRRNSPEFRDLIFSNRNKNSDIERAFSPLPASHSHQPNRTFRHPDRSARTQLSSHRPSRLTLVGSAARCAPAASHNGSTR